MFKKVLIANRGEIAVRVIRACRSLGIVSAAVYSEADRNSLGVILADEAYLIGPAPSNQSYLVVDKILEALKASGADAVHPGYGFLSENPEFARAVREAGATFIGPDPESMEEMGNKLRARELMDNAGVPTVPGSKDLQSYAEVKATAERIGFPVIIKAASGGGGKGMRVVLEESELESSYEMARSEARNYFSDDTVYMERFIGNPKHIEVQVFGDNHGNVVHLYERECSMQRRHQKVIEEAPSSAVPPEVRERMGEIAVKAAKSINYKGAGTFEFIFDAVTKEFFFMEMNTRIQVEHPVTEMITGTDLVQEQIRVASGEPLSFRQEDIAPVGHAIECRINAEDPETFMPSPGLIRRCRHPQGPFVRVDSCAYAGYEVPIHYDPMVGKLIVWGRDRQSAIRRLKSALEEFSLTGIKTNIVFHKSIMEEPAFLEGTYTTQFIEKDFSGFKDMFRFVNDEVFLITAAVETYNQLKKKSVAEINLHSRWKLIGRKGALRGL